MRCTQSRRRTRSRSSDSMRNSTTGSARGIARREPYLTRREHSHHRAHEPRPGESIVGRSGRAEGDHLHVVGPGVRELRRVPQHRREHRCVGTLHAAVGDAVPPRTPASSRGPSGSRPRQGRRRFRCPTAGGSRGSGSRPRSRSPPRASIVSPSAVRMPTARRSSRSTRSTRTSPRIERLGRPRAGLQVRVVR